jgi:hypothetical protein
MFLWVLKTESDDDLEYVHDVAEGIVDSSTTKVKKPKALPKTPPKPTTIAEILLHPSRWWLPLPLKCKG